MFLKQCFALLRIFLFYFSYGKLSLLLSIGIDGTFWKDENEEMCECQYFYLHAIF